MEVLVQIWRLLTSSERRQFLSLAGVVLLLGLVEVVGVASVLPFMQMVSRPESVMENPLLRRVYEFAGFESVRAFLIATGTVVLALFTLTNLLRTFTEWYQLRVVWQTAHGLGVRFLRLYLRQPYQFFLLNSSADLGKELLVEVNEFAKNVLLPTTKIFAGLVVGLSLVGLLVVVDARIAVVAGVIFSGTYLAIYLGTRGLLLRLGKRRYDANVMRFRTSAEALQSAKMVKISEAEEFFLDRFRRASAEFSAVSPMSQVLSQVPRYAVEVIAIGGGIGSVLLVVVLGLEADEFVPLLILYAVAGYRLLPSLQQVFRSLGTLRYYAPVTQALERRLVEAGEADPRAEPPPDGARLPFRRSIEFRDVSFRYDGASEWALRDVSFAVSKGTSVGLVGTTGAGKTTLVDLFVGLLEPTEGQILVDGEPLEGDRLLRWRRMLGYVPQETLLYDESIRRNVAFGFEDGEIDERALERAVSMAQAENFIDSLVDSEKSVGERGTRLSGGQRQRLGLARAFYRNPEVLLLDEATSALDAVTEDDVRRAVDALGDDLTIVIVAHRLATVRSCDRILVFEDGRLVGSGSYDELLSTSERFRTMADLTAGHSHVAHEAPSQ